MLHGAMMKGGGGLCVGEEVQEAFDKEPDLVAAELGLAVESIDEGDGHLGYCVLHLVGAHHHLHLEHVALGHARLDQVLEHLLLV